ncbi:MAG TPA: NTF2 fold immunity protein [Candidatus Binatia bacterium]
MAINLALWLILVVAFLAGFSFLRSTQLQLRAEESTPEKALKIGREYIETHYSFDKRGTKLVINDLGDSWQVTYQLPENTAGGAPVAVIDKKTLKVIRSFHAQ